MSIVRVRLPLLETDDSMMLLAAGAAVYGPELEPGRLPVRIGTCIAAEIVGRELRAILEIDPDQIPALQALGLLPDGIRAGFVEVEEDVH